MLAAAGPNSFSIASAQSGVVNSMPGFFIPAAAPTAVTIAVRRCENGECSETHDRINETFAAPEQILQFHRLGPDARQAEAFLLNDPAVLCGRAGVDLHAREVVGEILEELPPLQRGGIRAGVSAFVDEGVGGGIVGEEPEFAVGGRGWAGAPDCDAVKLISLQGVHRIPGRRLPLVVIHDGAHDVVGRLLLCRKCPECFLKVHGVEYNPHAICNKRPIPRQVAPGQIQGDAIP